MTAVATAPASSGSRRCCRSGRGRWCCSRSRRRPLHHLRRRDRPAPRGRHPVLPGAQRARATGSARTATARSSVLVFGIRAGHHRHARRGLRRRSCGRIGWPGARRRRRARRLPRRAAGGSRSSRRRASSSLGILGLWESSVETLAPIIAAVVISLAIGVPLGILAGRNERFAAAHLAGPRRDADHADVRLPRAVRPVLRHRRRRPRRSSTLIYAMPAAIRITALGIRGVPTDTVEAATVARRHRARSCSRKVQLPLARKDDRPGAQPDDHAGALDDRDHRADRGAGPGPGHPAGADPQRRRRDVRRRPRDRHPRDRAGPR